MDFGSIDFPTTPATSSFGAPVELDRDECLARLASTSLGRVALSDRALPMVVPVMYRLDGDAIEFEASGRLLPAAAYAGHVVCFETDHADLASGQGWSVVVVGRLQVGHRSGLVEPPSGAAPGAAWRTPGGIAVRLPVTMMTGRLLG